MKQYLLLTLTCYNIHILNMEHRAKTSIDSTKKETLYTPEQTELSERKQLEKDFLERKQLELDHYRELSSLKKYTKHQSLEPLATKLEETSDKQKKERKELWLKQNSQKTALLKPISIEEALNIISPIGKQTIAEAYQALKNAYLSPRGYASTYATPDTIYKKVEMIEHAYQVLKNHGYTSKTGLEIKALQKTKIPSPSFDPLKESLKRIIESNIDPLRLFRFHKNSSPQTILSELPTKFKELSNKFKGVYDQKHYKIIENAYMQLDREARQSLDLQIKKEAQKLQVNFS